MSITFPLYSKIFYDTIFSVSRNIVMKHGNKQYHAQVSDIQRAPVEHSCYYLWGYFPVPFIFFFMKKPEDWGEIIDFLEQESFFLQISNTTSAASKALSTWFNVQAGVQAEFLRNDLLDHLQFLSSSRLRYSFTTQTSLFFDIGLFLFSGLSHKIAHT